MENIEVVQENVPATVNATTITVTPEMRMKTVADDIQSASKSIVDANKLISWAGIQGVKNVTENLSNPNMVAGVAFNIDAMDNMLDRKQSELRDAIKKLKAARENLAMVRIELPGIE